MGTELDCNFYELSQDELSSIDGGLFGVAWLTAAMLVKAFAGGVTLGGLGAATYLGNK